MSHDPSHYRLISWDRKGILQSSSKLEERVLTYSGNIQDCDVFTPCLKDMSLFIEQQKNNAIVTIPGTKGRHRKIILQQGVTKRIGEAYWTVVKSSDQEGAQEDFPGSSLSSARTPDTSNHSKASDFQFLSRAIQLISMEMSDLASLSTGLGGLVDLFVHHGITSNAVLVMYERSEPNLLAWAGLTRSDAHKLWEKIPATIAEDVMRQGARLILPEELEQRFAVNSTIFIKGVNSVCGFPIFAEGKIVALLVLGFKNILSDLTEVLQSNIESLSALIGLVIQRAMLREQLKQMSHFSSVSAETSLMAGRLMIGQSREIDSIYQTIRKLAPTRVPVLITGETGCGKELAAKELHRFSTRHEHCFVAINAAALPENLIEAELFGHAKGSFTGALSQRAGLIEQAAGGTLFIDEIGELPLMIQAKLLRVLQEKSVRRIGENASRHVDFRLITATNRNLKEMIKEGSFREDLFYRISGAVIALPALRERRGDILLLANYFKKRFSEFHHLPSKEWSSDAIQVMNEYPWNGNIRELENTVERATIMCDRTVIQASDLGLYFERDDVDDFSTTRLEDVPLNLAMAKDDFLRQHLLGTLDRYNWQKAEAAKALGIGLRTLFRYLEQLNIAKDATGVSEHV